MRGTGTTTQQLKSAAKGALFIWNNNFTLNIPKSICCRINRPDIKVVGPHVLTAEGYNSLHGSRYSDIIVDHALEGMSEHYFGFARLMEQCIRKPEQGRIDVANNIGKCLKLNEKL
jgi:hypothetical protein